MRDAVKSFQKHLMTATSYMIPFVVAGGIIFAVSVMLNGEASVPESGWLAQVNQIGSAGLALFIPVLGGYIAYSMADKPGLAPGFIGAYLAREVGAGFLGGILAGFIAGYAVLQLKKIKIPPAYRTLGAIFLYPLGILLGSMVGVDMGGPINKVAYTFAQTQVDTLPYLMGGVGIAGAVPPLGIGLATLLFKKKFSSSERDAGKAAIIMGCMGITEGAIPFATADPLRVIPAYVIGSAAGCTSGFLMGCLNHAPWGGLIVLPVVDNRIGYLMSALIGAAVVALMMRFLKKDYIEEMSQSSEDTGELEITFEDL